MNRNFGYSQFIIPNPCHFPKYSDDPKEKRNTIFEIYDPISRRTIQFSTTQNFKKPIGPTGPPIGPTGPTGPTVLTVLFGGNALSNYSNIYKDIEPYDLILNGGTV